MEKRITAVMLLAISVCLCGCSNPFSKQDAGEPTPDPYAITIHSVDELENDTYYIKHGDDFYEIPEIECSFEDDEHNNQTYILTDVETPDGIPNRTIFYSKDKTELLIPTLYQGDELVYKSSEEITDNFTWERYMDGGYTIGVCGITLNNLNKLSFTNWYTNILDESPIEKEFGRVEDEEDELFTSLNVNSVDGKELTKENLSEAGYIMGLPVDQEMTVDFYQGTALHQLKLKADARIFYNFENYWTKGMSYSQDGYVVINVPEFFKTGYYKVNTSGMFRYVNEPYNETADLSGYQYNRAYYKKDKDGNLIYKKDEDGNYVCEG